MDATNVILCGDLHEEVFIELPQVYTILGSRIASSGAASMGEW